MMSGDLNIDFKKNTRYDPANSLSTIKRFSEYFYSSIIIRRAAGIFAASVPGRNWPGPPGQKFKVEIFWESSPTLNTPFCAY